MKLISEEYRKLNAQLHDENKKFGAFGGKHKDNILHICSKYKTTDVLDYGCGKGSLAEAMPFHVKQYDPAIEEHSKSPEAADIVVCTDVLEHIEPESIDNVLDDLQSLTKKACFFVISTRNAFKTLADGRNAHLIVKPSKWWIEKLFSRFEIPYFCRFSDGEMVVITERLK